MTAISVVIPALNEEGSIAASVRSAVAAGAGEVLVVDGGSTDATAARADSAGAQVILTATGRATQMNAGAAATHGALLVFLHADCRLHHEALQKAAAWMAESPTHVAGGFVQRIDDPRLRYRLVELGNSVRVRTLKWVYGDQALFVRRDIFEAAGGFPPLKFMEDLFLSRWLRRHGEIGLIAAPLQVSARRWQRRGIARQTLRNWWLIGRALLGTSPDKLVRHYPNER